MKDGFIEMIDETYIQQACFELRSCTEPEKCSEIQYKYWRDNLGNTRLITRLAIYRENVLKGTDNKELEQLVKAYKIPKKYLKLLTTK